MASFVTVAGWLLLGAVVGVGGVFAIGAVAARSKRSRGYTAPYVSDLLESHFHPTTVEQLTISERTFPHRVRADLQQTIDRLFAAETEILHFSGVRKEYSHEGLTLADCIIESDHYPAVVMPPEYEEVDIGDEAPIRCLKTGLWLLEENGQRFAVFVSPASIHGMITGIQFQVATTTTPEGTSITQRFFKHLEDSVLRAESYRGKILSLEKPEYSYSGAGAGIAVHRLRTVDREQVILPQKTLELLERNVIQFVQQREQLSQFQQATKKGILFYGPPGTGKTHTIHYLAKALEGHTTFLISAEQVGLLSDYMMLARLLQPSIVVMEDVDLIARERTKMGGPCEEALLNKLLNEMDGLTEAADILFILTTNRPEALEAALASRPGRVDQAIEFPLPDEVGRAKLVRLYSQGIEVSDDLVQNIVQRTGCVSAAFIKELMRRSVQYHLQRNGTGRIEQADVDGALEELLFSGGSLNLKMLGAESVNEQEAIAARA